MPDQIHTEFANFTRLLQETGASDLEQYKTRFFEQIDKIARLLEIAPDRDSLEEEFFQLCEGLDQTLLHGRTRRKPLGYAGDFLLIDWIYTHKTGEEKHLSFFDRLFHSFEAAESVRNRKSYFIRKCNDLSHEKSGLIDILDLGCGSCRDVVEAFEHSNNGHNLHFHCIDQEPEAIAYAQNLLKHKPFQSNVTLTQANVIRFKSARTYDLIWSAGLFDYLEDRVVILLLRKLWRLLKPGGQIIFGNFSPRNPTRNGMELVGRWYLIHRTAEQLIALCEASGLPFSEIEVESEDLGINLFCILRKPETSP